MHFPMVEMAAPESLDAACALLEQIVALLRAGRLVVAHCKGGVGRAGLLAACLLLRLRLAPNAAQARGEAG